MQSQAFLQPITTSMPYVVVVCTVGIADGKKEFQSYKTSIPQYRIQTKPV
jgi:hypothetical protein